MCTKCEKCKEELIEITSIGEVRYEEYLEDDVDEYGYERTVLIEKYTGQENKTFLCKDCLKFYDYYYGIAHDDTDEYWEHLEEIDLELLTVRLAEALLENPSSINFVELESAFKSLEINFDRLIKHVAFTIVNSSKPLMFERIDKEVEDDEVPF